MTGQNKLACGMFLAATVVCTVGKTPGVAVERAQARSDPTFNHDVAPILFAHCVTCHRPGDIAPMPLLTYEDARPWARAIKAKVLTREMPPWPADRRYGSFGNQPTITDAQIDTLVTWVDAGALRGDGVPPQAPTFIEGWTSQMDRPPDEVIESPAGIQLPAGGVIPEFKLWSQLPFGKDRFVQAIELRPTNRRVMHHASVFRARLPRGAEIGMREVWPGGPVLDAVPLLPNGRPAPLPGPVGSFGDPLVFYVPAGGVLRFPTGAAKRLQPQDHLLWTFHLMTTGKMESAGGRIGLWYARRAEQEVVTLTVTETITVNDQSVPRDARGPLLPNIAPHDANYKVTGLMRVAEPITLYALWPHMHSRGRSMTFILEDRRGREQTLLSVPRYRYEWQFVYKLATPLRIQAGSTIKAIAHYDNSSSNPHNPDPSQEVIWGAQATDEMFNPFLEVAFDRRSMQPRPSDCNVFGQPSAPGTPFPSPCP